MTCHFDGDHSAQGDATQETGTARIHVLGHAPCISRQIVTRLRIDPAGQQEIAELLTLRAKDPLIGPHPR